MGHHLKLFQHLDILWKACQQVNDYHALIDAESVSEVYQSGESITACDILLY